MDNFKQDLIKIMDLLMKNQDYGFHTIEIAEKLHMFPIQVEMVLRELVEVGAVECKIYKNKLYAHFKNAIRINESGIELKQFIKVDMMYA